ncbi:cytochrome C biogenesis protein CcmI [Brevundimonas sp. Leaf363]|uniref:c-type cytochrome biogenesis protein CcmI n=1 Tax=Brevundimonas sp. Leaf363 TaxID=1736353 RepID=UPI0006F879AE|nr:c-type cytochrome biogenesis protein CcmI [Brevundimonas sp. Leaf363]KQS55314.1 cytochrome C biogenesis protein CcmI [Brevundimonas sp. Leaf363]
MTAFWILTALAAALAGYSVLFGARRPAVVGPAPAERAERELEELERLRDRGLIEPEAYQAARAEAARRALADAPEPSELRIRPKDRMIVLGGLGVAVAGALGLYVAVGFPGYGDQPYARRVDDWSTRLETLEPAQLAAVADRVARRNPEDMTAQRMLGAARFEAGDPIGAAQAFRRILERQPDDAQSWARLGESLVRANQGAVGGDAEAAFFEALKRDPGQLGARYFLGEAALTRGDAAAVRGYWLPLIAALEPNDPRRTDLERRLPR